MKVIELLTKIANGEEKPKEVLFDGNIYKWCNDIGDYRKDGWGSCLMIRDIFNNFNRYGSLYNMLFEDAEIIEEPKEIEKLNDKLGLFGDVNTQKIINELNYTRTIINKLRDEINNLKENKQ